MRCAIPTDPWGHEYHYTIDDEHLGPVICSLGADDAPGGQGLDEDIVSPNG